MGTTQIRAAHHFRAGQQTTRHSAARLAFLDELRCIAAIAVFVYHAGLQVSPRFATMMQQGINVGSFGVLLFFLSSGFIIPISLERHSSLGRFWLRRLFRLYPLYWFSLALIVGLDWSNMTVISGAVRTSSPVDWLIQLTMFQSAFGRPFFMAVYWTLMYEMIFYAVVSLAFVFNAHRQTTRIVGGMLLLALLVEAILPFVWGYTYTNKIISYLAIMWLGTLFYRWYTGQVSLITVTTFTIGALLVLCITNVSRLGWAGALPVITAHAAAVGTFVLALAFRTTVQRSLAANIGQISYSIYLIHPLVIAVVGHASQRWLTVALWSAVVLAGSIVTYKLIEQPALQLESTIARRIFNKATAMQPGVVRGETGAAYGASAHRSAVRDGDRGDVEARRTGAPKTG